MSAWLHGTRSAFAGRILRIDDAVADERALMNVPNRLPIIGGLLAATANVHVLTLVMRNVRDVARTGVRLLDPFAADPTTP